MSTPQRESAEADADAVADAVAVAVAEADTDRPDDSFAHKHGDKLIAVGILALLGLLLYFNA